MTRPESDETSIGCILIAMGLVTPGQVARAREEQSRATECQRIGVYLIAHGHLSLRQLHLALNAQEGLRSKARHRRALAQASIAEASGSSVLRLAGRVKGCAAEVRRKTNQHGYPVVATIKSEKV